jgi:hypothetical protein
MRLALSWRRNAEETGLFCSASSYRRKFDWAYECNVYRHFFGAETALGSGTTGEAAYSDDGEPGSA